MPSSQLVLASGSPQRRRLLADAGYQFEIVVPHDSAECGICSTGGPAALVAELARRKAEDVRCQLAARQQEDEDSKIIIACDTVAECDGAVLGKPVDEEHARDMLKRLRGNVHRVYSGLCLGCSSSDSSETGLAVTELRMDPISDGQLEEYLVSGLWQGKAGSFGYQDRVDWLHILEGSESNVIGLPMELLREMLLNSAIRNATF